MKKRTLIVIVSLVAVSVVLVLCGFYLLYDLYRPRTFYDTGISDEEYIEIVSQTLEAQKFLDRNGGDRCHPVNPEGCKGLEVRLNSRSPPGVGASDG